MNRYLEATIQELINEVALLDKDVESVLKV